jgi:hypothetical protein
MTDPHISSRQRPEQSSGIISIEGDKVIWHNIDLVFATFNLSDIVVIGEHTNSNGPWFDDWFIDFVTKGGKWFSIPWYADNIDELTKLLCAKFEADLNGSFLTGSTKWASVVRHPVHLKNKPLFKLTPTENYKEPKTIFDKMLYSFGLGNFDTTKKLDITDEVKSELTNASR